MLANPDHSTVSHDLRQQVSPTPYLDRLSTHDLKVRAAISFHEMLGHAKQAAGESSLAREMGARRRAHGHKVRVRVYLDQLASRGLDLHEARTTLKHAFSQPFEAEPDLWPDDAQ
jgi:hypothetical protein